MNYQCSDVVKPMSLSQAVDHFQSHLKPGHIGQIHSLDDGAMPAVFIAYAVSADGNVTLDSAITDACPLEDASTWQRLLEPYQE
ncbi:hypothetical protein [Lacticaseibacillus porcinae]|uniref:hypothetical protein n=1 Tax=Lacticaseibacillus porcinae TaxID=1123687 RepID=UPI000F79DE2F|nr:hypothetical protein [Lacticaseibacillus porcinae]